MNASIALTFVKFALPAALVYLLGSALIEYLDPAKAAEPANLPWIAVTALGTWFFWARSTRKGVT